MPVQYPFSAPESPPPPIFIAKKKNEFINLFFKWNLYTSLVKAFILLLHNSILVSCERKKFDHWKSSISIFVNWSLTSYTIIKCFSLYVSDDVLCSNSPMYPSQFYFLYQNFILNDVTIWNYIFESQNEIIILFMIADLT